MFIYVLTYVTSNILTRYVNDEQRINLYKQFWYLHGCFPSRIFCSKKFRVVSDEQFTCYIFAIIPYHDPLIQQGINTRAYISLSYFLRIKKINLTKLTYYNKASENQVMKLHSNTCFFRSSLIFVSFIEIFLIEIFIEINYPLVRSIDKDITKWVFRIYNK